MKKLNVLLLLCTLIGLTAKAQVKDISLTLSPTGEYTWWDDKAGFNDGVLIGGNLGFGFGEYLEIRAIYQQSLDLKTNFENFGLTNYNADLFTEQDVTLTRWGGEFKANIGTNKLSPYITIGTGIQSFELDNMDKLEQIYASLGLGIKFNIAKRIVFTLEGKNTTYRFDAGQNLLTDADKTAFGTTDADFSNERLSNWSVMGSLQFYLGGRRPGTLSPLDQAYLNQFKGGFKGLQFVLEPSANHLTFDDNSLFRDTYMIGGYAGIDFNEYVGIRGFYLQATENDELSTSFDKLSMYGLEFRANLNDGNGVIPYLILGGGYLNPESQYMGIDSLSVEGTEFASAGLGLTVPLGKNVAITGGARAMVTSGADITDINGPKDLQTHFMYNVGLKFNLGKKSKSPNIIYQDNLNKELDFQQTVNNQKIQQLKSEYQDKINNLELNLKTAYEAKDVDKVVELLEEKNEVTKSLKQVEDVEVVQAEKLNVPPVAKVIPKETTQEKLIQMTPAEFESLIDKILKNLDETPEIQTKSDINPNYNNNDAQSQIDFLNKRIDLLERLLLDVNARKASNGNMQNYGVLENDMSEKILSRLEELNQKIDGNSAKFDTEKNEAQTIIVTPTSTIEGEVETEIIVLDDQGKVIEIEEVNTALFKYNSSSVFGGVNIGGATTANFGFRMYYDINKTKLQFMPEIYVGVGKETSYGLSGNVIYPISLKNEKVKPYIGAGLGFGKINDESKGNYNIIIGAELPFLLENLYVDFTTRNLFDYNQLAIGYKLNF